MVAFIIVMAQPPHTFTTTAQVLLTLFFVLFVGSSLLGLGWLFFIEAFMYRMWLASFSSDWAEREDKGWWDKYVRLEKWLGGVEHAVYTRVKAVVSMLPVRFGDKSKDDSGDHAGADEPCT